MNNTLFMIMALIVGLVLGGIFFGGLWFTVRKAMESKIPALWFFGSFIIRIAIVLVGFYAIMQPGNWLNGLVGLAGFIIARFATIRLTKAYDIKTRFIHIEQKETINEA